MQKKATICVSNTCATVYGTAAKVVTGIAVSVTLILAIAAVAKALK